MAKFKLRIRFDLLSRKRIRGGGVGGSSSISLSLSLKTVAVEIPTGFYMVPITRGTHQRRSRSYTAQAYSSWLTQQHSTRAPYIGE